MVNQNLILGHEAVRQKALLRWEQEDKHCPNCGERISYERRKSTFCNRSCGASYNNRRFPKRRSYSRTCLNCGSLNRKNTTYCSPECGREYRYGLSVGKWLRGEITGSQGSGKFHKWVKQWLMEQHDNKCETCGWGNKNEFTNTVPLEVHHLDGDSKNNRPENLQLLCPNCHSLTKSHCGANTRKANARRA